MQSCAISPVDAVSESVGSDVPSIPDWTGFNTIFNLHEVPPSSRIGYLPVINSPSTERSTCTQVLNNALNVCDQLSQEEVVVVADQAIYAKLQELVWQDRTRGNEALYSRVILRMGTFHTIGVLLAVIGKRFANSGLQQLLVDGDVVSAGSANAVLDGKHYNRAVRSHLITAEALEQVRWKQFEESLAESDAGIDLDDLEPILSHLRQDVSDASIKNLVSHQLLAVVENAYADFCRRDHGPMFQFWSSFIDMVSLLRCLIRATRQGNWQLHLQCILQLLPWVFAYDRTNYCRYLSVYLCEMLMIQRTHPSAAQLLENGEFGVQRSRNSFSQVPVDQALEQTINRDTKVSGGKLSYMIIGP